MQGTKKVIELALEKKAKFVYSASSSKFGNSKNEFLSPYAWTKSKNVELIKCYREWYGLEYVIAYFYNVYGPRVPISLRKTLYNFAGCKNVQKQN